VAVIIIIITDISVVLAKILFMVLNLLMVMLWQVTLRLPVYPLTQESQANSVSVAKKKIGFWQALGVESGARRG
jgi:hypothetical protein